MHASNKQQNERSTRPINAVQIALPARWIVERLFLW